MQSFKIKRSEYIDFKRKRMARTAITKAIRTGQLERAYNCELCDEKCKTHAHHVDYGKPLSVVWVCTKCHGKCHTPESSLNPKNNKQTNTHISLTAKDTITVSVSIPVKNFIILKKKSLESKQNISQIIRSNIIKEYEIESNQLEFNFDEDVNDKTQNVLNENVCSLGENESLMLQQERPTLPLVRRTRNYCMPELENKFPKFFTGYGRNSRELQFPY